MKFIFERGIYEFIQFHKIDEITFAPAKTQTIDKYIMSFDLDTEKKYLADFVKLINKKLMEKLINN